MRRLALGVVIFAAAIGGKAASQLLRDPGGAGMMTDLLVLLGAVAAVLVVMALRWRSRGR